jgi:hypothetical protein
MEPTLLADKVTLYDLGKQFGLQPIHNDIQAFQEWQGILPKLTEQEKERLDRVKESYLYLSTFEERLMF